MAPTQVGGTRGSRDFHPLFLFITAWLLCAVFYFVQYALRSAPGVMVPELTAAWQLSALGLSSLLGMYFFTYASLPLVAGASLDRYGAKWTIPAGIACALSIAPRWYHSAGCSARRSLASSPTARAGANPCLSRAPSQCLRSVRRSSFCHPKFCRLTSPDFCSASLPARR